MKNSQRGITLVELLMTVLLVGIMAATSAPGMSNAFRRYQLDAATREIAQQLRSARLKAVTSNQTMRVRFNCPEPGQLRVVEVVDTPAIDDADDRCSAASYPYPDRDDAVVPNLDGPVMVLRGDINLNVMTPDIDIAPTGRMTARQVALPLEIIVTDDQESRAVRVTAAGRVGS